MTMTKKEEAAYMEGERAALNAILRECCSRMGYSDIVSRGIAPLIIERNEAIAALRNICGKHGDNDWPDNLHLADIIDKHLRRHLDAR